ncbi:U3 small nucleolar RNA-associated protein 6-domain-containing protein [Mycena rebaudengoi]|nr:U3 small nucleolar RNA-associated protein 6-domain-containing protein [Mycena rebaudengoi]
MERVQFQQEQMLDELKDLVEKNLFTKNETKQIMKKRTVFETALVRRVAKKADFLRYAAYEMGLEQLRRKRVERLKLPTGPATVSDYALRFKADVGLWIQYIELAKREGASTLVGRVTARALQLHPDTPALYILAAAHELEHGSPSGARTLLQRGLRLNGSSVDLWREYVKMELGFVEGLRRRWDVLGVNEKGKGRDDAETGTAARNAIIDGAIVTSVIDAAVKARSTIDLFEALIALVKHYPVPDALTRSLLDQLYGLLREKHPASPRAARILADRFLTGNSQGEALVDAVQSANEEMLSFVAAGDPDMLAEYVSFCDANCKAIADADLKTYLLGCLRRAQNGVYGNARVGLFEAVDAVQRISRLS